MNAGLAHSFEDAAGLAIYMQCRHTVCVVKDFHVMPRDLSSPACFERFQECFFSGKACSVALRSDYSFAFTIFTLGISKYALSEPRSSGDGIAYSINFDNVDADGNYHGNVIRRQSGCC